MALNLGELFVQVGADTTGLKEADSKMSAFVGRGVANFAKLAAGITVVSTALFGLAKSAGSTGDQFQKMSDRLGVSAKTLSEFSFAAKIGGTTLASVETSFRVLSKRMLDANNNLSEAVRTFDSLNIVIKDSEDNLRGVEEVFLDAVDAINALGSETEKTALAQELFGRSGTQLLPLIKTQRAGIEALREEANELGAVYSDLDAEKSAMFEDSLTRLSTLLSGIKNTIGLQVIPAFTFLADKITNTLKDSLPTVKNYAKEFGIAFVAIPEIASGAFFALDSNFTLFMTKSSKDWRIFTTSLLSSMAQVFEQIGRLTISASAFIWVPLGEATKVLGLVIIAVWKDMLNDMKALSLAAAIFIREEFNNLLPEEFKLDTGVLRTSLKDLQKTIAAESKPISEIFKTELTQAFKEGRMALVAFGDEAGKSLTILKDIMSETFTPQQIKVFSDIVEESLARAKIKIDEFTEKLQVAFDLRKTIADQKEQLNKSGLFYETWIGDIQTMTERFQDISRGVFNSMATSIGDSFAQMAIYGENLADSLEASFRRIAAEIISTTIRALIFQSVLGLMGGGTLPAALIGGVGGGGGTTQGLFPTARPSGAPSRNILPLDLSNQTQPTVINAKISLILDGDILAEKTVNIINDANRNGDLELSARAFT